MNPNGCEESAMKPTHERRTHGDRRKNRIVRKAIFPAAGLGARFLPATKAQPKEMLPLVDKPIIHYSVEEAVAAECDEIIIITGRGKSAIEDHFDVSYELEKMLEEKGKHDLLKIVRQISDMIYVAYVRQKEALGLGHAVLTARELIGNAPFPTLLADDVIDAKVPVLKQLMSVFEEKQCSVIATQIVEGPAISSYGVLKAKEVASSGGELQLTDGLRGLLRREKTVRLRLRRPPRYWRQTGLPEATAEFAFRRDDLGGEFRKYLKGWKL